MVEEQIFCIYNISIKIGDNGMTRKGMVGLLDSIESITTIKYDTKVDVTSGANTGITAVVSMTKAEK
ncbi:MAG: hypothetical protein ACLRS1_10420 [Oscillospiraceae bacterium]